MQVVTTIAAPAGARARRAHQAAGPKAYCERR
jgi:hypothetical protein